MMDCNLIEKRLVSVALKLSPLPPNIRWSVYPWGRRVRSMISAVYAYKINRDSQRLDWKPCAGVHLKYALGSST